MKIGELYKDKKGNILLYTKSILEDWHDRKWLYEFRIITAVTFRGHVVLVPENYLSYLEMLPRNHPAWILYGNR